MVRSNLRPEVWSLVWFDLPGDVYFTDEAGTCRRAWGNSPDGQPHAWLIYRDLKTADGVSTGAVVALPTSSQLKFAVDKKTGQAAEYRLEISAAAQKNKNPNNTGRCKPCVVLADQWQVLDLANRRKYEPPGPHWYSSTVIESRVIADIEGIVSELIEDGKFGLDRRTLQPIHPDPAMA